MRRINNLKNHFENIVMTFNETNAYKILQYLKEIPLLCDMDKKSKENRKLKSNDSKHLHPVSVGRGEIYNLEITEGIGSELSGNHLVIIIQNQKGNMYGEKVNELPIEGDGTKTNSNYQMALYNTDLISGSLNKNPSRIILTDIMTFDKARLKNKIATIKPEKINAIDPKIKKLLFTVKFRKRARKYKYYIFWLFFEVSNQPKKNYSFLAVPASISDIVYGFPSHSLRNAVCSFIPFL